MSCVRGMGQDAASSSALETRGAPAVLQQAEPAGFAMQREQDATHQVSPSHEQLPPDGAVRPGRP